MTHPHRSQAGAALVSTILVTFMLFGIAGSYLVVSHGSFESSNRERDTVQAKLAAEDGIQLAIAEIKQGIDADSDGLGALTTTAADGRTVTVAVTTLGANLHRLHSVAVLRRARSGADVVIERIPAATPSLNLQGAISSKGPVQTLGSLIVDGRDWNDLGTAVSAAGIFGISCADTITTGGDSKVGGHGTAPAKPPPPGTIEPACTFADGADNDGDGSESEEIFDGVDDDDDGLIDEDTHGFPSNPDTALHLPPGSLKSAAIATSTYFTSAAQVAACVAANGGSLPGGRIIYCDFSNWSPVNLGNAFNESPSILVQHNATSTAVMGNVTGMFKGLLLADAIEHFTGTFMLLGGVLSFADESIGNAFGLGTAEARYSSSVLANLPAAGAVAKVRLQGWSRSVAQWNPPSHPRGWRA